MIGTSTVDGQTTWAFSDPFLVIQGQTYTVQALTFTDQPPPLPESLEAQVSRPLLTAIGQRTQMEVFAHLGDGTELDVHQRVAWTSYRSSNPLVVDVGLDGGVTATGPGEAYLTATNSGVSAVVRVIVDPTDQLTEVSGRVIDEAGAPLSDAEIWLRGTRIGSSDREGWFHVEGVPADVGELGVFARLGALSGESQLVEPWVDGITDVGDVTLVPTSEGTEFAVCFQRNYSTPACTLNLGSDLPASGTVRVPGLDFEESFETVPGVVTSIGLPPGVVINASDGVADRGVLIESDHPVNVYGLNRIEFTTDAFTALPTTLASNYHRVLTYGTGPGGNPQFAVVAIEDGTTLTIVPAFNAGSRQGGVPYQIQLDRAQVYQLSVPAELSGSSIISDRPVSVFAGHSCANIPEDEIYCDHLCEQIPPVETWATEYFTVALAGRTNGDRFRVLADEDGTVVSITGDTPIELELSAGEFAELVLDGGNRISANRPVLVAQFAHGGSWDGRVGDPSMMMVPPRTRYRSQFTFATPPSGFSAHWINVVVDEDRWADVLLDGLPVTPTDLVPIPGGLVGIRAAITAGSHTLSAPVAVGLMVYGWGDDDSYAYPGGL